MTNLGQHSVKTARNALISHGVDVRLMCALQVPWVGSVVPGVVRHTVREFRDPPSSAN